MECLPELGRGSLVTVRRNTREAAIPRTSRPTTPLLNGRTAPLLATLIIASTLLLSAQESPPTAAFDHLATIGETTVDWAKGTNVSSCMVVLPGGRLHLERRTQRLPNPTATLQIFESTLDTAQLRQLVEILGQADPRTVPPYVLPPLPMDVPWFYTFSAEITREHAIQRGGYWDWRGGDGR